MRKVLFLILVFSIASCEKSLIFDQDTPSCIKDKISDFKKELKETCTEGSSVKLFEFQSKDVFVFERGTCFNDFGIEVFNEECELMCTLGTLLGITECNGEEFDNATEIKTLWKG